MHKVLIWYWGRRGGGPSYTLELYQEALQLKNIEVFSALSVHNELLPSYSCGPHQPWMFKTYQSKAEMALRSIGLPFVGHRLWRLIKKNRIGVVISTMPHYWNPFVLPFVRAAGAQYVPILHDLIPHSGDRYTYPRIFIKQEIHHARFAACLSEYSAHQLSTNYKYPRGKIVVAPRRFEASRVINRESLSENDGVFRFLFFGRIFKYKGLKTQLQAFNLLLDSGVKNIELTIAGEGDVGPYRQLLNNPAIKLINRWLEQSEIDSLLQETNVVMAPYNDATQSGVVHDALANGKPSIVTSVGALPDQVQDRETGFVVPPRNPRKLADAMQRISSRNVYQTLKQNLETNERSRSTGPGMIESIIQRLERGC